MDRELVINFQYVQKVIGDNFGLIIIIFNRQKRVDNKLLVIKDYKSAFDVNFKFLFRLLKLIFFYEKLNVVLLINIVIV